MLLKDIVDNKHYRFIDKAANWKDSIRQCCIPLEESGVVTSAYADEIIACVEKHGPYIVLMPNFALPHSMENSAGAKDTAIGFMKVEQPVEFDPDDRDKDATVFFTLASVNSDQHLANMRQLFKMLTNEELCSDLLQVKSPEDLLALDEKYS